MVGIVSLKRWKSCQKKRDQVAVHGERHGDVLRVLSRTPLGKAGALLGYKTQVSSMPQWDEETCRGGHRFPP